MTRYHNILTFALLLAGATGCSKFLEVDNIGKSSTESFFAELSGLESALDGLYSETFNYYDDYMNYADLASDLVDLTPNASELQTDIFEFQALPEDNAGYPRLLWKAAYNVVTNANNILHFGPKLKESYPDDAKKIDRILGEAYFIRALMFLELSKVYSQNYTYTDDASHMGIPTPTQPLSFNATVARPTLKATYTQILEDLGNARKFLAEGDPRTGGKEVYYVSDRACRALLARVYLYMGNYEEAEKYASEVIAEVPLTPYAEYEMMFRYPEGNPGKESILRLSGYEKTSSLSSLYDPTNQPSAVPSQTLLALFDDPEDLRGKRLLHYDPVYEGYDDLLHGIEMDACVKYYINEKYLVDNKGLYGHVDPFVLRCSEMYLIRAEALCNRATPDLEGAAADLKALIARATGKDVSQVTLTYAGKEEMNVLIEKERMRELCFEGHRLTDITRRHQNLVRDASTTAKTTRIDYPDYRFVLPICQLEMDSNGAMKQNPGYVGATEN